MKTWQRPSPACHPHPPQEAPCPPPAGTCACAESGPGGTQGPASRAAGWVQAEALGGAGGASLEGPDPGQKRIDLGLFSGVGLTSRGMGRTCHQSGSQEPHERWSAGQMGNAWASREAAEEGVRSRAGWLRGDRRTVWVQRPARILPTGGGAWGTACQRGHWDCGGGDQHPERRGGRRCPLQGEGRGRPDSAVLWALCRVPACPRAHRAMLGPRRAERRREHSARVTSFPRHRPRTPGSTSRRGRDPAARLGPSSPPDAPVQTWNNTVSRLSLSRRAWTRFGRSLPSRESFACRPPSLRFVSPASPSPLFVGRPRRCRADLPRFPVGAAQGALATLGGGKRRRVARRPRASAACRALPGAEPSSPLADASRAVPSRSETQASSSAHISERWEPGKGSAGRLSGARGQSRGWPCGVDGRRASCLVSGWPVSVPREPGRRRVVSDLAQDVCTPFISSCGLQASVRVQGEETQTPPPSGGMSKYCRPALKNYCSF